MDQTERRRQKYQRRLDRARDLLASTDPTRYSRSQDYRRVLTQRRNAVRRLERIAGGEYITGGVTDEAAP